MIPGTIHESIGQWKTTRLRDSQGSFERRGLRTRLKRDALSKQTKWGSEKSKTPPLVRVPRLALFQATTNASKKPDEFDTFALA